MTTFVKADDVEWQTGLYIKHVQKRQMHEPNPWALNDLRGALVHVEGMSTVWTGGVYEGRCWNNCFTRQTPAMQKREEASNYTFNLTAIMQILCRRSCTVALLVCTVCFKCLLVIAHNTKSTVYVEKLLMVSNECRVTDFGFEVKLHEAGYWAGAQMRQKS